jgi:hypothetical protein
MKKKDVPQDRNSVFEGETKVVYAISEQGKIEIAQSSGWDVEAIVLEQAIEEIKRHTCDALERAHRGETSALEYHMYAQRMDLTILAQTSGRFKWQIRRDFNPKRFNKLSSKVLEKYADVLGIDVETLIRLPKLHE